MNSKEMTQKHLQERIDLEAMQQSEVVGLLKQHRLSAVEATGKYFERKRQQEMSKLIEEHKQELNRLFDSHDKEWEQWRSVKKVIRDSQQLSFDQEPKSSVIQKTKQEEEPEKGVFKKVLSRFRNKKKDKQQEM